ncbi:sigma-70 family RNA polymerase sigma factor [Amycolatopsis sp. K13G38]|uniref:Sigma-70 family RNA polymerase sigma factor n=1 Tax=Amycolatopsis acididurans TaxID=2724524 RepID=A0ABX1JFX2_9PSEU|nr:sigma-70 family RNA polymerase sigma factor [Amycolatopsis acididurans]NKQ57744.1 sigma-70 family RNA polymerase sigma factor [Amycolatopsis acididurans]
MDSAVHHLGPEDLGWTLVRAIQQGEGDAFEILYRRYARDVYAYAFSRSGNRFLAEDVTSEVFARALRSIGSLESRGKDVRAWLVTIARNLLIDQARSGRARYEVYGEVPHGREQPAGDPADEIVRRARCARVRGALRDLTDDQRNCLLLRFFFDRTVAEAAALLDRDPASVRALQHRAVRRLRELLHQDPAVSTAIAA